MMTIELSYSEKYFLALLYPNGTINVGTQVGWELQRRGLVSVVKFGRYGLTPHGADVIREIAGEAARKRAAWREANRKR